MLDRLRLYAPDRPTLTTAVLVTALVGPPTLAAAAYAAALLANRRRRHRLRIVDADNTSHALPGPVPTLAQHALLGHMPAIATDQVAAQCGWVAQYGRVSAILAFVGQPTVTLADPVAIYAVLSGRSSADVVRPGDQAAVIEMVTGPRGMLALDGEDHRMHRQLMSPLMGPRTIKSLVPGMTRIADELVQAIRDLTAKNAESTTIDAQPLVAATALNAISRLALATDFDALGPNRSPVATAYTTLLDLFNPSAWNIARLLAPPLGKLPVAANKRVATAMAQLTFAIDTVVGQLRATATTTGSGSANASLAAALMAELTSPQSPGKPAKSQFSAEDVQGELKTWLIAGHETTAAAVGMMLYFMAAHPGVQETLFGALGDNLAADDAGCEYLAWVVAEGLRVHAPVHGSSRVAAHDLVLPLESGRGTLHVPQGTRIMIPIQAMHLDPEIWGPDAAEFKPERWHNLRVATTPDDVPVSGRDADGKRVVYPTQYMPFWMGRRACFGKQFAMLEIRAVLATVVRAFKIEIPDGSLLSGGKRPPMVYNATGSAVTLPLRFVSRV